MPKLTKKLVDSAVPRDAPFFVWCSDLPGFGVRVFPSGKRVYYADYRNRDGGRKRMSLGAHGKLTTEEARKLAMMTLGDVLKGGDPREERATRRKSITMAELCDDYLIAAGNGLVMGKRSLPKKASTLAIDKGRIERHIKPLLGRKLVKDVERADIVRFISDVTLGKTAITEKTGNLRGKAIVEGGRGTAARTTGLLGGIMSFAVSAGIIDHNPATGVKKPADKRRQRRLTAEEYRQLGTALAAAEAEFVTWQGIEGAWLFALTGCRHDEAVCLRWAEVDEPGSCFRLTDTKEGASVRPVGRPALDRLLKLPRATEFVLPAVRGEGSFGGMPGAWKRLMTKARLEGVTPHTLRHSFASVAGDLGFTESTIGAMLGHSQGTVTSRYIHHLDGVLVAAADKVARTIYRQMTGEKGKVVQMPKRGRAKN